MRDLFIPDLHFPFCNMDALHEVYRFNQKFKADRVWQLGDMVDFYNFSRFIKSALAPSLSQEVKQAAKQIAQFTKWFPKVTALTGNHEKRIFKRANEVGIPKFWLRTILDVLGAPQGLQYAEKDYLKIDERTLICHGHLSSQNAKKAHMDYYGMNTVHGHIHNQLGVEFNGRSQRKIWGMSTSCIVDKSSIAMQYGEQDWSNIICGFGYKDGNKPYVECLG